MFRVNKVSFSFEEIGLGVYKCFPVSKHSKIKPFYYKTKSLKIKNIKRAIRRHIQAPTL